MDKDLASLRKFLDASTEKKVATETLLELAEIVLKKNIFRFNVKTLKELKGTVIGTTFATIFVVDLQKRILEDTELQPCIL